MNKVIFIAVLVIACAGQCVHDEFIKATTKYYYDDLAERRLLQTQNIGPLRIFSDYTQVDSTDIMRSLVVKRIMNITSNYFYNLMKVNRLNKLYYPSGKSRVCTVFINSGNSLTVPEKYVTLGVDADIGIVVGS